MQKIQFPSLEEILGIGERLTALKTFSLNRPGEPYVAGEIDAALGVITEELGMRGVTSRVFHFASGPVLEARVGPAAGPLVTWLAHGDVTDEDAHSKCELRIVKGEARGRGVADMKLALSCMIPALGVLAQQADVAVCLVVDFDEERTSGERSFAQYVAERGCGDFVIAGEPTNGKISLAAKGTMFITFRAEGVGAHGSRPHLGVNAADKARAFLNALDGEPLPVGHSEWFPEGATRVNTSLHAAKAPTAVPYRAVGTLDCRYPAGITRDQMLEPVRRAAETTGVELEVTLDLRPVAVSRDNPWVATMASLLDDPEPFMAQAGTSDLVCLPEGVPGVECGIGSGQHGLERVPLSQVEPYARLIIRHALACGRNPRLRR